MAGSVQILTEMSSLCCLTLLAMKSPIHDNNKVLDNLISYLESLGSPCWRPITPVIAIQNGMAGSIQI